MKPIVTSISVAFTVACVAALAACKDHITPDKITAIDGIVLGKEKTAFFKQFDSLNLPHRLFLNKWMLNDYTELTNQWNQVGGFYTTRFNHNPHNTAWGNECIGLLCPVYLTGTENYVQLRVLLCNTQTPTLFQSGAPDLSDYLAVNQNVNQNIITEIVNLYTNKYGTPTRVDSNFTGFYVIEKGSYTFYGSYDGRTAVRYVWKNKYLDVELFSGFESKSCKYDMTVKGYKFPMWTNPANANDPVQLGVNEIPCREFPYIEYRLTDTAIAELTLDKVKI